MAEVLPKAVADAALADAKFTRWHRERANRAASKSLGSRSGERRKGDGWVRTARDEQLLEFVTLHGMILFRQAAKWMYGGKESTASQRVSKMVQAGLLNSDDGVATWAGEVLTPTRAGQQVGLQSLPSMFESLAARHLSPPDNLLHAALVADRILVAKSQGHRVLTERQIRLLDRQDPDAVAEFLSSPAVGVKFSEDGYTPGVVAGRVWRSSKQVPGAPEPPAAADSTFVSAAYPRENQRLDTKQPGSIRFPDFVTVSPSGELIAMEIEIAAKASDRLQAIVAGYSDAVARLIPDGQGGFRRAMVTRRDPATGEQVQQQRVMLARKQFRQVRWLCVPEAASMLRGRLNPVTGKYSKGYIAQSMPDEYNSVDWSRPSPELPMLVEDITADDIGVQYRLDQRILPASYRCSYRRWRLWREVWADSVRPEHRGILTFARWLMVPAGSNEMSNVELCQAAEESARNAGSRGRAVTR